MRLLQVSWEPTCEALPVLREPACESTHAPRVEFGDLGLAVRQPPPYHDVGGTGDVGVATRADPDHGHWRTARVQLDDVAQRAAQYRRSLSG